jgi:UPF0176 protein
MEPALVNLGFYRFFRLDASMLPTLREELRARCAELGLKGTILLASEGVNAMLSGTRAEIDAFKTIARERLGVSSESFKESRVREHSFTRLLVKIKKELVPVGNPALKPDERTAERLAPRELRRWLDDGRPLVLLDARNGYEIKTGTFRGAIDLGLDHSREFVARASEWIGRLKDQTVVTFCTGGIRCEKASAALLDLGFKDVYQLDGGILRYFEEEGAAHFEGRCFVFDWREAVDGELRPAPRSEPGESAGFGRHARPATSPT